ncbi:MAG: hypothetical protein ABIH67_01145 [Candidatus Uhrbacteria bacterium]
MKKRTENVIKNAFVALVVIAVLLMLVGLVVDRWMRYELQPEAVYNLETMNGFHRIGKIEEIRHPLPCFYYILETDGDLYQTNCACEREVRAELNQIWKASRDDNTAHD